MSDYIFALKFLAVERFLVNSEGYLGGPLGFQFLRRNLEGAHTKLLSEREGLGLTWLFRWHIFRVEFLALGRMETGGTLATPRLIKLLESDPFGDFGCLDLGRRLCVD